MSPQFRSGAILLPGAILLLLIQSWWMWSLRRNPVIPHTRSLAEFPLTLNGWRSADSVTPAPKADQVLSRTYKYEQNGRTVTLLVAYYRTQLGSHPIYASLDTGWPALSSTIVALPPDFTRVHYDLLVRDHDRRLILSWFQTKTRILSDEQKLHFYRTIDAIFHRRTDLAFVEIAMPVVGGESDHGSQALVDFACAVRQQIQALLFTSR